MESYHSRTSHWHAHTVEDERADTESGRINVVGQAMRTRRTLAPTLTKRRKAGDRVSEDFLLGRSGWLTVVDEGLQVYENMVALTGIEPVNGERW
jgi:hypothetical protein